MNSYKTATPTTTLVSFDYDDADPNDGITWPNSGVTSRVLANSGLRRGVREVLPAAGASYPRLVAYSYDNLNRLTRESLYTGTWATESGYVQYDGTPGYDAVGNRGSRAVSNFGDLANSTIHASYDVNDWLDNTLSAGTATATFDPNGNTLRSDVNGSGSWDQASDDVYDLENRLVQATRSAGTITLVYDGDGNRVEKTIGSATTLYLVDDRNLSGYAQVLEERPAPTGDPTVTYVYGLDLVSQKRGSAVSYYGYDGLGSVRYLTDANGDVTDTYTYDAFGILIGQTPTSGQTPNNYLFTGEQYDSDLGVYYLRARYYKPELGRFWTMDTYAGNNENPLSLHKYLYCQGNSVNQVDLSGRMSLTETLTVITVSTIMFAIEAESLHRRMFAKIDQVQVYVNAEHTEDQAMKKYIMSHASEIEFQFGLVVPTRIYPFAIPRGVEQGYDYKTMTYNIPVTFDSEIKDIMGQLIIGITPEETIFLNPTEFENEFSDANDSQKSWVAANILGHEMIHAIENRPHSWVRTSFVHLQGGLATGWPFDYRYSRTGLVPFSAATVRNLRIAVGEAF